MQKENVQSASVEVGGRKFTAVSDTSFEQDILIMQLLHESGLRQIAEKFNIVKDDLSDVSQEVIIAAFKSGKLFQLLGAVMVEDGKEWTLESAKANADFFAKLSSREDKSALKGSIVSVILGFFVSGLLALGTSEMSSVRPESVDAQQPEKSPIAANTTSEIGESSSGNSESTTQTATPQS